MEGHVADFSFTMSSEILPLSPTNTKKENLSADSEKLVFTFTNENDFSAWFDALQIVVKDIISISTLNFTPHSLFQIYAILTINHGITQIEKELLGYQPPIPPLPSKSYKVSDIKPNTPRERKQTIRVRRNTSWIDEFKEVNHFTISNDNNNNNNNNNSDEDEEEDDDLDLDKIVDAKLSELALEPIKTSVEFSNEIISPRSPRTNTISAESPRTRTASPRSMTVTSPRQNDKLSWIRPEGKGSRKSMLLRKPSKSLDAPKKIQH